MVALNSRDGYQDILDFLVNRDGLRRNEGEKLNLTSLTVSPYLI